MTLTIRPRHDDDMVHVIRVLAEVHAANAYPLHWPADPHAWLMRPSLLAAWVVEEESAVVGHVSLRAITDVLAAAPWSEASAVRPEHMAEVATLFLAPHACGHGLGRALLSTAIDEALHRGLLPVLEVLDNNRAAIALYERAGWRRVTSVTAPWAEVSGGLPLLHYYIGPASDVTRQERTATG